MYILALNKVWSQWSKKISTINYEEKTEFNKNWSPPFPNDILQSKILKIRSVFLNKRGQNMKKKYILFINNGFNIFEIGAAVFQKTSVKFWYNILCYY